MKPGVILAWTAGIFLMLAACAPSDEKVRRLVQEEVSSALAAIPTVTPQPAAKIVFPPTATPMPAVIFPTPLPTATPVMFPPTATPQPTPTPQPTATPMASPPTPTPAPTPVPAAGSASNSTADSSPRASAGSDQAGGPVLNVNPATPLAGRDIQFTLQGLEPWQSVTVGFLDPRGVPVEWISEFEVNYTTAGGEPLTQRDFFADDSGAATWLRVATQDTEGIWGVTMTIDGVATVENYSVTQFQLPDQEPELVGIELRRYQGFVSDTYYSTLVPATLAVDLQAHLNWVADQIQERQGIHSTTIPDIYLAGNRTLFEEVAAATGTIVGFEAGFFRKSGTRPGIFMRTDFLRTNILRLLTHEYLHLVLDEVSPDRELPPWLNEGTARYFEYTLNLETERPDSTRVRLYRDANIVKSAALDGTLIDLRDLESLATWNSQTDDRRVNLQYAEAYMAVRYLTETHGGRAAVGIMKNMGRGANIFTAIEEETGVAYPDFQTGFLEWLKGWDDPRRSEIRDYLAILNAIMREESTISDRRAREIALTRPLPERVTDKEELAADAQALVSRLEGVPPPVELQELHQSALSYLRTVEDWLSLELAFVRTGSDANRTKANDMLPEVNGRGSLVLRAISDVEFVYNLD